MTSRFLNLVFSPSVKAVQQQNGSRQAYSRADQSEVAPDRLTGNEAQFIAARDGVYMASVGEGGWPYIQHRGGPAGFVKVLDDRTLGIADFRGNRQYVSVGNFTHDPRVALFFMDYPQRARLKLLGRARVVDLADNADLAAALADTDYSAKIERCLMIDVEAFDWNCPQHITPRYTFAEIEPSIAVLKSRIEQLEAELSTLRSESMVSS
jgi:uncharacterized protein